MSFICNDSLNCEELLNSGDVFSVFLLSVSQIPSEKLPSSYHVQNLNCSFSSINHFCPQRFLCSQFFRKNDNFHPGLILTYSSHIISGCSHGAHVKETSALVNETLASSQVIYLFPLSCVACEDKQEILGWDLSSPTSERASPTC